MGFLKHLSISSLMAVTGLTMLFGACGDESTGPEGKCDPGSNVFCRCPGGEPGTRECLGSGEDFGECVVAPETPCGDRIECEPEEAIYCLCPNGDEGTKECFRDGTGFGECMTGPDEPCPVESTGPGMGGGMNTGGSMNTGGGTPGECAHDLCAVGEALETGCDPCATTVCDDDDYCCTTAWDEFCVGAVDTFCDNLCNPVTACEHDPCMTGAGMTDGCDACVTSICDADDMCCMSGGTNWDSICVTAVKNGNNHPACAHLCCAHSECLEGANLDSTCSLCATNVCMLDSWCCNNEWDEFCVTKAEAEPSCNCP